MRRATPDQVALGQLVVFAQSSRRPEKKPAGDPPWTVKRAVALPGDPVPPHLLPPPLDGLDSRVPPECLVVLGDNRTASYDSRRVGYIDGATLLGVVHRVMT